MKPDEREFLLAVANRGPLTVRRVVEQSPIHPKRAWYLLWKWSARGWYEYGVSIDMGWLTTKGKEIARTLAETTS